MKVSGWGRYPLYETDIVEVFSPTAVPRFHRNHVGLVPRGNGRAYGDAAIGDRVTLSTLGLNRMLAFDPHKGHLTVEAGVLLRDILFVFIQRGFPFVVPETRNCWWHDRGREHSWQIRRGEGLR